MRILFFILALLFASMPFFMAHADESAPLKCHGTTAVHEDEMPFATDDQAQAMVYQREGKLMRLSIAGTNAEYKDDEKFVLEETDSLASVRDRKTGDVVLSLEKLPLLKVQKRWGAKAKYLVRGLDPRNGQSLAKPVEVLCEKSI